MYFTKVVHTKLYILTIASEIEENTDYLKHQPLEKYIKSTEYK